MGADPHDRLIDEGRPAARGGAVERGSPASVSALDPTEHAAHDCT